MYVLFTDMSKLLLCHWSVCLFVVDFPYQLRSFARTSLRLNLRLFCSVGFPYRSFRRRCSMVIDKFLEGKWTVSSMFPLFPPLPFFHYPRLSSFYESSSFRRGQQITDTIVGRLLELTRALFKIRASTDFQLAFASQLHLFTADCIWFPSHCFFIATIIWKDNDWIPRVHKTRTNFERGTKKRKSLELLSLELRRKIDKCEEEKCIFNNPIYYRKIVACFGRKWTFKFNEGRFPY